MSAGRIIVPKARGSEEQRGATWWDEHNATSSSRIKKQRRTPHACEPCRQRKAKCNGEHPQCQPCQLMNLECRYVDGKRERTKRELSNLSDRVEVYQNLLTHLCSKVDGETRTEILRALETSPSPRPDETASPPSERDASFAGSISPSLSSRSLWTTVNSRARSMSEDKVGSVRKFRNDFGGDPNAMEVDSTARGADYLQDLDQLEELLLFETSPTRRLSLPLRGNESLDFMLPEGQPLDSLLEIYFSTVHPAFPFLSRAEFLEKYRAFQSNPQSSTSRKWLAMLNFVFAIGAVYADLTQTGDQTDVPPDTLFYSRARRLHIGTSPGYDNPDLDDVRLVVLAALYYTTKHLTQRAWIAVDCAFRYGLALRLHLEDPHESVMDIQRPDLLRIWCSIISLKHLLERITGLPPSLDMVDPPGLLRLEAEEASRSEKNNLLTPQTSMESETSQDSNDSAPKENPRPLSISFLLSSPPKSTIPSEDALRLMGTKTPLIDKQFFHALTDLVLIGRQFLRMYRCAEILSSPWAEVQQIVQHADVKIRNWRSELSNLSLHRNKVTDISHARRSNGLCLSYYSTRIVINRPSLYRLAKGTASESLGSHDSDRHSAGECVKAALNLLQVIPDTGNPIDFFKATPWFCLLQYLIRASGILLISIKMKSKRGMVDNRDEAVVAARKAVRILDAMGLKSPVAERASAKIAELLQKASNAG